MCKLCDFGGSVNGLSINFMLVSPILNACNPWTMCVISPSKSSIDGTNCQLEITHHAEHLSVLVWNKTLYCFLKGCRVF